MQFAVLALHCFVQKPKRQTSPAPHAFAGQAEYSVLVVQFVLQVHSLQLGFFGSQASPESTTPSPQASEHTGEEPLHPFSVQVSDDAPFSL